VTPALASLGAAIVVIVLAWALVAGHRSARRGRWEFAQKRRLERARRTGRGQSDASVSVLRLELQEALVDARRKAAAIVADAEHKAAEIVAAAERDRERILAEARKSADEAAEITEEAERKASALVREAERQEAEIVARAETARRQLEHDLANERKLADEKREELSAMLVNLLGEVQRNLKDESTNVLQLRQPPETKGPRAETGD
jgi:hypothetical protein